MSSPILTFYILVMSFLIYLIQDGKALMLCFLAPFCEKKYHTQILKDILPSWDANQTWLVFTIAGTYGAFPDFFGDIMSQYYTFFLMTLILFIIRGASIEFYIKSTKLKKICLYLLSSSSLLLLICQMGLCTLLLNIKISVFLAFLPFILWFNWTQASCFLFPIKLTHRFIYVTGLVLSSHYLMMMLHVSIGANLFTTRLLLLLGLLVIFMMMTFPKILTRALFYYVFFSNAFFILQISTATDSIISLHQSISHTSYSSFFIINLFSVILLPMIAIGLSMTKKIFFKSLDEIVY
jgi:Cytochrome bd terminal oxidase subunit II